MGEFQVLLERLLNVFSIVIDDPAYFRVLQRAVDAKGLQGARGNF